MLELAELIRELTGSSSALISSPRRGRPVATSARYHPGPHRTEVGTPRRRPGRAAATIAWFRDRADGAVPRTSRRRSRCRWSTAPCPQGRGHRDRVRRPRSPPPPWLSSGTRYVAWTPTRCGRASSATVRRRSSNQGCRSCSGPHCHRVGCGSPDNTEAPGCGIHLPVRRHSPGPDGSPDLGQLESADRVAGPAPSARRGHRQQVHGAGRIG